MAGKPATFRDWWVSTERFTCWVRTRKSEVPSGLGPEWGEVIIDSAPLLWQFHCQPAKNLRAWCEKNGLTLEVRRIQRPADFKSENFI